MFWRRRHRRAVRTGGVVRIPAEAHVESAELDLRSRLDGALFDDGCIGMACVASPRLEGRT